MPLNLQIIRASEFIRLDPHELLDFEASKQTLQALARACLKRSIDRAILDLRSLPVPARRQFTPTELALLVGTFRDAGFSPQQRLAILYSHDVFGGIRAFAFISRLKGLNVKAFNDFEAAFNWLSEDDEARAETRKGEIPVAITKAGSQLKRLPVGSIGRRNKEKNPRPEVHKRFVRHCEQ